MRPKPQSFKIGGLTVISRTGAPPAQEAEEILRALYDIPLNEEIPEDLKALLDRLK